jgi:type 1 glutamine amidotransferase
MEHIRGGAGFIGLHAATDSFYKWPEYGKMINGYFDGHPWNQVVVSKVEEPDHPLMKPFGKSWKIKDEIYQFKNYDRGAVRVLMSIDNSSIDVKRGKRKDNDYAMCWIRMWGKGRVLYNAHGHDANVFQDKAFQEHMKLAMKWCCGDMEVDASPRK